MNFAKQIPDFRVFRLALRKLAQVNCGILEIAELQQIVGEEKAGVVIFRVGADGGIEFRASGGILAHFIKDKIVCLLLAEYFFLPAKIDLGTVFIKIRLKIYP